MKRGKINKDHKQSCSSQGRLETLAAFKAIHGFSKHTWVTHTHTLSSLQVLGLERPSRQGSVKSTVWKTQPRVFVP
jgi:hypothetical protein